MKRAVLDGDGAVTAGGTSLLAGILVLLSSACCVGPLAMALSVVGLGGSTMLAIENVVGPFRPFVLGLTVTALAFGFYVSYRRPSAAGADGATCRRGWAQRIQRPLLWLATLLFLAVLYFSYVHPNLDLWFGVY